MFENKNSVCKSKKTGRVKDGELDIEVLRERLIADNKFFTMLVDSIPAKMYFDKNIKEKISSEKHLQMNKISEEISKKSFGKLKLSDKSKHKRASLDPSLHKTVSEIHEELDKNKPASFVRAANIEELQKRLQSKINDFRTKRKALATGAAKMEARRLKKKMKREKNTKLKRKKGNKVKGSAVKKNVEIKNEHSIKSMEKEAPPQKVFNKDGTIIYSKFDFHEEGNKPSLKSIAKRSKDLLTKVEKEHEKIENLKQTDAEKADNLLMKAAWKRAIDKSEGGKVADDPKLLKKSLKKIEKKKKKSAKQWKERLETTEKKKQQRQDKREKNIKAKKKEKVDRKIKRAKKKGRIIPGF